MVHPDLNIIFHQLVTFAQRCLAERGGFLPFAASMDTDGKVNMLGADVGPEEQHNPAPAMIRLLTGGLALQAKSGRIRAAGICFDALYRAGGPADDKPSDAIQCALEHDSGESLNVFLPYQKSPVQPNVYGKAVASRRVAEFFTRAN
jgi:hypothetical protein